MQYDLAITLLGIYQDRTVIQRDTCTTMFKAALFIIAKTWKQPRYPATDEWIKKTWYTYTMEYYPNIEKNEINDIFSKMDGPRNYHTK